MAIVFRVIFITVGIALVERFGWLLYIFGAVLVFTGVKMFAAKHSEEVNLSENKVYNFLKRFLPLVHDDGGGKFKVIRNGKKYYTSIFVVVVMLATTDIVFALDSIPAVFGISTDRVVIYTSNIFAVLGLRSLVLFTSRSGWQIRLPSAGYRHRSCVYRLEDAGRIFPYPRADCHFFTRDPCVPGYINCIFYECSRTGMTKKRRKELRILTCIKTSLH